MANAGTHEGRRRRAGRFGRGAAAATVVAATPALVHAADAGRVAFVLGAVTGTDADGKSRRLTRGATVRSGETIRTSRRGRVQIRFQDGGYMALKPNTTFRIDDYEFRGEEKGRARSGSRSLFSLIRGGLRTLTGLIGKRDRKAYQLRTRVATIGIRGTGYGADDDGEEVEIDVVDGEIEVCNDAGCSIYGEGDTVIYTSPDEEGQQVSGGGEEGEGEGTSGEEEGFVAGEQTGEDGITDAVDQSRQDSGQQAPSEPSPTPPSLPDGSGYALAVSFGEGSDGSGGYSVVDAGVTTPATVDFEGANTALVSYKTGHSVVGSGALGTAQVAEAGADGIIGWGRWTGGTTALPAGVPGGGFQTGNHPMDLTTGTQSLHYVTGEPTPSLPTSGSASYSLLGSTTPTLASGNGDLALHKLNSASLSADFAISSVTVSLNVTVKPDGQLRTYDLSNVATTIGADATFSAFGAATGPTCPSGGCSSRVHGFFAGANAERAGLSYDINTGVPAGTGNDVINGAAAFEQDPLQQGN